MVAPQTIAKYVFGGLVVIGLFNVYAMAKRNFSSFVFLMLLIIIFGFLYYNFFIKKKRK